MQTELRLVRKDEAVPAEERLPVIAITHRGGVLLLGRIPCGFYAGRLDELDAFTSCTGYAAGTWENVGTRRKPFCVGVDIGRPVHGIVPFLGVLPHGCDALARRAIAEIDRLGYVVREDGFLQVDV